MTIRDYLILSICLACTVCSLGCTPSDVKQSVVQDDATTGEQEPQALVSTTKSPSFYKRQPAYWLGIRSHTADEALLTHLDLCSGVTIDEVFADGPSDRYLQPHDVIYSVNGSPIGCPRTLVCKVNESCGQELTLGVCRRGKLCDVTIAPLPIKVVDDVIVQFVQASDYEKVMGPCSLAKPELISPCNEIELVLFRPGFVLPKAGQDCSGGGCRGDLHFQMAVSFLEDDHGELITIVRKGDKVEHYSRENVHEACPDVRALVETLLNE